MLHNLVAGDVVTMRIELDQNEVLVINTVGGSEGLQNAYLQGGTITVTPGFPVQIAGASGKLLHVAGDVAIDGIIDPTGITFTQQSSNPFDSSSHGLYVTNAGDLIFHATSSNPPVNLTQAASGSSASSNLDTYLNDSGVTITAISPVSLLTSGGVQIANPSDENSVYSLIGIMASTTLYGAEGAVYTSGRLPCGIFAYTLGDSLWLGQGGVLTNVKPSPGVDGFNTGDFVVQMGTVIQNKSNTAAVDILIRISIVGQL
jgi:hypothetical protein